ncbi:MAG: hypothetical protein LUQ32_02010 [Methanomicrobiales archaeon]|nr:hypothetical protein [Methanomicrobiales archaeon]
MRAAGILELGELTFLEPTFASLTEDLYTTALLGIPAVEGRLLIDRDENPLAVAVSDGKGWYAASFLFRSPPLEVIELCEDLDSEIHEEERSSWLAAVREYYGLLIRKTVTPALEDLPPERLAGLRGLLEEVWGRGDAITCLDCCCGSGVGSSAARGLGMLPLSYDSDPALLSLGLSLERLHPEETMWIDATLAGQYLEPVPRGIAVMMGEINSFTGEMWESITGELLGLVQDALITVGTEQEARRVEGWCRTSGHRAEVTENRRDEFYDRWVCRSTREG